MLRDFSWRYFASTGDIHAYLLYREHCLGSAALTDEASDSTQSELGETQVCL
ncbi:YqzL family protein [Brevibacillus sp. B_LB10_24]|uniref:YqzL family protein n=1 Tax=Brevibacillus sp. B_LB10_24 TaxID=3380645 RepID=UPI0038B8A791